MVGWALASGIPPRICWGSISVGVSGLLVALELKGPALRALGRVGLRQEGFRFAGPGASGFMARFRLGRDGQAVQLVGARWAGCGVQARAGWARCAVVWGAVGKLWGWFGWGGQVVELVAVWLAR